MKVPKIVKEEMKMWSNRQFLYRGDRDCGVLFVSDFSNPVEFNFACLYKKEKGKWIAVSSCFFPRKAVCFASPI